MCALILHLNILLRIIGREIECQLANISIDRLECVTFKLVVLIQNGAYKPDALALILVG